jgi:hypothetical protein
MSGPSYTVHIIGRLNPEILAKVLGHDLVTSLMREAGTMSKPYALVDPGQRLWHVPDAGGQPLCGVRIRNPERRYLPAEKKTPERNCRLCQTINALGPQLRARVLDKIADAQRIHAGDLQSIQVQDHGAKRGIDVVMRFGSGVMLDLCWQSGEASGTGE